MTTAEGAFEVIPPSGRRAPVVVHVPHASTAIPAEVHSEFLLSPVALSDELLRLTDWYTDDLFAGLSESGATSFVNRRSRLVFDPERFLDDTVEPMAARGQGVVYWRGSQRQPLREMSSSLRARRVNSLYRPYHAALDAVVGELLAEFGECTLIDCHSFPSVPLPSEIDQSTDRPDICIGTDETHTPSNLVIAMETAFTADGFRVARNSPFSGTFVPSGFYARDDRVRSVMIEVRRGLYLDETDAQRLPRFESVAASVTRAVEAGLGPELLS